MINILLEYSVPIVDSGHKHSASDWVQVCCPFCNDDNFHMGFNTAKEYFHCYRCGWHHPVETLTTLTSERQSVILDMLNASRKSYRTKPAPKKEPAKTLALPKHKLRLEKRDINYLEERNFNPINLQMIYGIESVGPVGKYKFRILIPIYQDGRLVSFTSRDTSDKAKIRYKTCPKEEELMPVKNTLYALDDVTGSSIVVVEGPTDVWRMGRGAVATYGLAFSSSQIKRLAKFKDVHILFDKGRDAERQAKRLMNKLYGITNVSIEKIKFDDPGSMPNKYAKGLMSHLLG